MKYIFSCLTALLCLSSNLFAQWAITGNSGTVDGTNFIGTTDNVPLSFRVNNVNAGRIDSTWNNVAFGFRTFGMAGTGFQRNTAIGHMALTGATSTGLINNTAIGYMSLNADNTGQGNTAVGTSSLSRLTSGLNNVAVGFNALAQSVNGASNTALGFSALGGNKTGTGNVAIGTSALTTDSTAINNVGIGLKALFRVTGSDNIGIGASVITDVYTRKKNIFIGDSLGGFSFTGGNYNTLIGAIRFVTPTVLNNNIIIADGLGQRRLNVDSSGNFMVNTTTPQAKNTFVGSGYFSDTLTSNNMLNVNKLLYVKGAGTGTTSSMLVNNSVGAEIFRILDNGNIGIGISNPSTALAVAGTVSSKKVKVTQTGWPDFVFGDGYKLPDLEKLENYLLQHKHLPGIPTAGEIEKDGADLGDNQAAMLQKIEELTLYVIQQNKQIELLKQQNQQLQSLQAQLDELKKEIRRTAAEQAHQ